MPVERGKTSGSGMRFVVNILELLFYKLGVDLSGGDIRMSQHLLNGVDIGAVFQQMGREGVAQRVRGNILFNVGFFLIIYSLFFQYILFPYTLKTERLTFRLLSNYSSESSLSSISTKFRQSLISISVGYGFLA